MNRTVEMAFEFPLQFRISVEFVEQQKKKSLRTSESRQFNKKNKNARNYKNKR